MLTVVVDSSDIDLYRYIYTEVNIALINNSMFRLRLDYLTTSVFLWVPHKVLT